ncbi:SCP-like protein [Ancylostoma duodenale]|uniref:SCP-like protein n=1 Tax=Ancylostoma duodenale TaxID=51022 RepID=A0A0C2GQ52_9BILA|nr:SCP-like protein [Ancylostoma duodenale]
MNRRYSNADFNCAKEQNKDNLRDLFLHFHNEARRRVADGRQPTANGKKLKSAKNMYKLKWNCTMEQIAQDHIETCSGKMEGFGSWDSNSRTYRMNVPRFGAPKPWINRALKEWWDVILEVDLGKDNKYSDVSLYYVANVREQVYYLQYVKRIHTHKGKDLKLKKI